MLIKEDLYQQIIKVLPIPCVDLLIVNEKKQFLLVKRNNNPEKGSWWFPGGRIHKGETRQLAAIRKLKEECGIVDYYSIEELGTFDLFLKIYEKNISHGITSVFKINISDQEIKLDDQSEAFKWISTNLNDLNEYHPFINKIIKLKS